MKLLKRIPIFFILVLVVSACQKPEPAPILTVSVNNVDVPNYNGTGSVAVTSNGTWSATASTSWIHITPATGKGDGTIQITMDNNNTTTARTGTITVTLKNISKTITINQSFSQLSTFTTELLFEKTGSSQTFSIQSNTDWQVEVPTSATWLSASPLSGNGNASVTLTTQTNSQDAVRSATVLIRYASTSTPITITQKSAVNHAPTAPSLTSPANGASNTATIPNFAWSASTDTDGDPLTYTLSYSKDNNNWKDTIITKTSFYFSANFSPNTTYYWKVKVSDGENVVTSSTHSFTTGIKNYYDHQEFKTIYTNTTGEQPSEILILGDGYSSPDLVYGGLFDQDANAAAAAFFDVEPYKSYKNYFKVYKMATFSDESGVTQQDKSITKQTCFSSYFAGGSSVSTNYDKVFEYAMLIPGVDANKLKKMLIILMLNQDRYAGTCFMWSDGRAIAICPVSKSAAAATSKFPAIVNHEAGGHGWAGLADEYINSANVGKTVPAADVSQHQSWSNLGFYANVDVTGSQATVKWKHFIGVSGYERVSTYEGAMYYTYGAWRAESTSCMINNIPYYSAPAREAAVKKIKRIAGEEYSLDEFMLNDIQKSPGAPVELLTKSFNPLLFVPLGAPVMFK